jgi:hypothetical protein
MSIGIIWKYGFREQDDVLFQVQSSPDPMPSAPPVGERVAPNQRGQDQGLKTERKEVLVESSKEFVEKFRDQFGANLEFEFFRSGRLLAIHGGMGQGVFAQSDFRPDDVYQVRSRAKKILEVAETALGVQENWPLREIDFQGSKLTAHMTYHQTYQDLRVAPVGTVKIDLGPKGEVIALYSDYAPNVNVTNESKLTAAQALEKAKIPKKGESGGTASATQAEKVVWIEGTQGKIAYQFYIEGEEIVIDAQSGEVILRRNRRRS